MFFDQRLGLGYLLFRVLDNRAIAIMMAVTTLIFVGLWLLKGAEVTMRPRSTPKAVMAGITSGVTTMVAHSGGPPLAMYLLPLGLSKDVYAGTTSLFFIVGNVTKAVPWLLLVQPTADLWMLMAICLLAVPTGCRWVGSSMDCWTSDRSIAPATDCWSSPRRNCYGTGSRGSSCESEHQLSVHPY